MTRKQKRRLYAILASGALLIAALIAERLLPENTPLWGLLLLFLPAYLPVGLDVLRKAGLNILRGQVFDENLLMALATLGAFAIGFCPGASRSWPRAFS